MIFITGATGFIGGHLIRNLTQRGLKARCLARSRERARICEGMGFEAAVGDITNRDSLRGALKGVNTIVHLIGIIEERGGQTFRNIHVEGTVGLVEEAKDAGVRHFIYISALGASLDSSASYHRTKAEAEEAVKASGMGYTIFRPSIVVGPGDGFTRKLKALITPLSPFIPVPGDGSTKFQPIYVGDLVECITRAIEAPEPSNKVYELGGPEQITYNDMALAVAEAMGARKKILNLPIGLVRLGVRLLEKTPFSPATSEQLRMLDVDNTCDTDSVKKNFGFEPMSYKAALKLFISPPEPDS